MHRDSEAFLRRVAETVDAEGMFPPGGHILVAYSGGVDSAVLLWALIRLLAERDLTLSACHVHHKLRGAAADADERSAQEVFAACGIRGHTVRVDVPTYAATHGLGIEEAGRELRHRALRRIGEADAQGRPLRLALGHHADDAAETILMNIGRGAGLAGLAAMAPVNGELIRPLIRMRRAELEQIAAREHLTVRDDATNRDPIFLRNRVRHELLPLWRDVIGYDPVPALLRLSETAREDTRLLDDEADAARDALTLPDGSLYVPDLADLPRPLAVRVLRDYVAQTVGQDAPMPEATHLTALHDLVRAARETDVPQSLSLPGGMVANLTGLRLRLSKRPCL